MLSLFIGNSLYAQKKVELEDNKQQYFVSGMHIKVWKDKDGAIQPSQLVGKAFNEDIIDYQENPDWREADWWFKFSVKNNSSSYQWFIEIPDFHIENVAIYYPDRDTIIEAGYAGNFDKRFYQHKNFVFDLNLLPGEEKVYYCKMASSEPFGSLIKIRSARFLMQYSLGEYILLGFFYGFLLVIALYNLFVYFSIKDKSHLLYVFYVIAIASRALMEDGLGFQYIWGDFPFVNKVFKEITPLLLLVCFAGYSRYFLDLKEKFRVYDRYLLLLTAGYLVYFTFALFFPPFRYEWMIYAIPFVGIYIIAILVYKRGYKPARFFIIGYSLLIISFIIYFLRTIAVIPESSPLIVFFVYSLNIGFVVEAFTFSIALADKMKILKHEKEEAKERTIQQLRINEQLKDKVNRELEQRVEERTKELTEKSEALDDANNKLKEQAEIINSMNQQLDLENYKLKKNVKEINKERGLMKSLTFEEFQEAFPTEDACYKFIDDLKWSEGFVCKKCGNTKYITGNGPFARKCTKCTYNESIKANTLFHDLKFPLHKAFYMLYLTILSEGKISSYDLADKLTLRQKTCWSFKKRVLDKMEKEKISYKKILEQGWTILVC